MFKPKLKFSANFFGQYIKNDKPDGFEFVKYFLLFFIVYLSTLIDMLIDNVFKT